MIADIEDLWAEVDQLKARLTLIETKIKTMNCEYNAQHIEELHNENESLSMVYGDAYLVKLRDIEENINKIKFKINEMVEKYNEKNQY